MNTRLKTWIGSTLFGAGLALFAAGGQAQAAPSQPCAGPHPVAGVEIRGPVLHVIDGETICVALGYAPDEGIRLRLADAPVVSPIRRVSNREEADPKRVMMAAAFAKMAECRTELDADRQVVAVCTVDGMPLGRALRDGSVIAAGMSWR